MKEKFNVAEVSRELVVWYPEDAQHYRQTEEKYVASELPLHESFWPLLKEVVNQILHSLLVCDLF